MVLGVSDFFITFCHIFIVKKVTMKLFLPWIIVFNYFDIRVVDRFDVVLEIRRGARHGPVGLLYKRNVTVWLNDCVLIYIYIYIYI